MVKKAVKVIEEELDLLSRDSKPKIYKKKYNFYKIINILIILSMITIGVFFIFIKNSNIPENSLRIKEVTYLLEDKKPDSPAITNLQKNTRVTIINRTNEHWIKVKYGTLTGWIKKTTQE